MAADDMASWIMRYLGAMILIIEDRSVLDSMKKYYPWLQG